jgi:predicted MFS family arabinose efflux permease
VGTLSPLLTPIADRRGRKTGMLLGVGLFVMGSIFPLFWATFPAFLIAVSLSFLGMFLYLSSMQAYLGDVVPFERRGRLLSITEMGWSLAFILGMPLVGLVIGQWGWRAPFPLLAGLSLLCMLALARVVPNHSPAPADGTAWWHGLRQVLVSPPALAGLAMSLCFVTANEMVNLVFGVYLEDSFGLQIAALGAASALIGVAELSGELLSASLVDWLGKKPTVVVGMLVNAAVVLAFPWLGRSLLGAVAGLFVFYLSFEFAFLGALSLMTELLPEARATLLGVNVACFSLGRMIGSLLGPAVFAWGFQANALAALACNLLGLLALTGVKIEKRER